MILHNLGDKSERVTLRQAVLGGQPEKPGLYMPLTIPVLPEKFYRKLPRMTLCESGFELTKAMMGDDIGDSDIAEIIARSLNFPVPLVQLEEDIHVLELFHGPTLAFKDIGARFMAALFEYLLRNETRETTVITATSGDTGSAVANAFRDLEGVRVIILFPSGRVSSIQELMLTTAGGNVTALEVDGDFDACQRLVKQAFADRELSLQLNLTSANSINFGRLFPQVFYYFYGMSQLGFTGKRVAVSVPSGNFGNLTAGVMAKRMGLGISTFVASTNANDTFARYLQSGKYEPHESIQTLTNAMDVSDPSNFRRLLYLFDDDFSKLSAHVRCYSLNDSQTLAAMDEICGKFSYTADPHTAVAYLGLKKYQETVSASGIFLATAHPVKFMNVTGNEVLNRIPVPSFIQDLKLREKKSVRLASSYEDLKSFLLSRS